MCIAVDFMNIMCRQETNYISLKESQKLFTIYTSYILFWAFFNVTKKECYSIKKTDFSKVTSVITLLRNFCVCIETKLDKLQYVTKN